jgi:stress response protein YsnF
MSGIDEGPKHRAGGSVERAAGGQALDEVTVIRSEERLVPTTERVPVRRARLQRFVVTEQRTITVDVRHEEVRVVFDDVAPGEPVPVDVTVDATPPVLLREERLEVVRTVVPVERVRLVKERSTVEQTVSGTVRREEFDFDPGLTATGSP